MLTPPPPQKDFQSMFEKIIVLVLALGITASILIALWPAIINVLNNILAAL